MTSRNASRDDFDQLMTRWMEAEARVREPEHLIDNVLDRTSVTRRAPRWLLPERWIPARITMARRATPRLALVFLLVALLLAAAVAIAYIGSRPRLPDPFGPAANGQVVFLSNGQLFGADPDGSHQIQLTSGSRGVAMPVYSRDGTRIAFKLLSPRSTAAEPGLFGDLVVIDADGSNPITIVSEAKGMSPPAWSPDGHWLLYSLLEGGGTIDQVYIAAADGSSPPTRIGDPGTINWAPTFSPDGTHIAFLVDFAAHNHGVAIVNRDGSGFRMLNTTEFTELHSGQWHPDGTRFVVSAAATDSVDLWVLHLHGSEQQLRSSGRDEEGASWSPDGLRLAYLGTTNGTAATLNVAAADGTNDRIMPGVYSLIAPTWSPDGSRIAAVNDIGSTARVTLLDPDGVAEPIYIDGALPGASAVAPRSDSATWQRKAP